MLSLLFLLIPLISSNITQYDYNFDSNITTLEWCGLKNQVLFAITNKNSFYRSENFGKAWTDETENLSLIAVKSTSVKNREVGKVAKIIKSPVDKELVVLLGTHGYSWVSHNCGQSFESINHGRKITDFVFHPFIKELAISAAFSLCDDYIDEPCHINKELFFTKDFGITWKLLTNYVVQFGWGCLDKFHELVGIPSQRILVTQDQFGKKHQKDEGWSYKVDLVMSDDLFETKTTVVSKGNKFLLTFDFLFVAQLVDQESQEVVLLQANSKRPNYVFSQVSLPFKHLNEYSYTFVDTTEKSLFLSVNHFGDKSNIAHIYVSDNGGTNFTLSLKNNIINEHGHSEFEKYSALHGIYVANQLDDRFAVENLPYLEEEYRASGMTEVSKADSISKQISDHIKTVITFSKGGSWHRLRAPDKYADGSKIECDNCYLNLHGLSGNFNPFYSVGNAVGLMIGTGNVGSILKQERGAQHLFISRDAGNSWYHVKKGSFVYEIGDHGGIIVMAPDDQPTNSIYYSLDEGLTWETQQFSEKEVTVTNIMVDPNSVSANFILIAKNGENGVVYMFDFNSLNLPACQQTNDEKSDFEMWIPSNYDMNQCLLGKKSTYQRRKQTAKCFNGEYFDRLVTLYYCECTREDFTCDKGYYLDGETDKCLPENPHVHLTVTAPSNCEGSYSISLGYRRVPGNFCINGDNFDALSIPCPNSIIFYCLKVFVYLVIFAGIIFIFY